MPEPPVLDVAALFRSHRLSPAGVIHVGAHEGQEVPLYREMGFGSIVLVEANPEVFARLSAAHPPAANLVLVCRALCEYEGVVPLRLTTFDQSSSILRLKRHREVYPEIDEAGVIDVPCGRLDDLRAELEGTAGPFNLLALDVQGAELRVLEGAAVTLDALDAIVAEVNFEELYEGCVLAPELDAFLAGRGFARIATDCYHDPSWGDAFYLRSAAR